MMLSAQAALYFLPFVAPIALWVAWTDLKWMKIKNTAVLALVAVYLVIGLLALPFQAWAWGWLSLAVVLALGFVMTSAGLMGAGDAKFAAAMAPFIALGDLTLFLMLLGAIVIVSFVGHRVFRASPLAERVAPGWESWHRREFPMGLALGPALLTYVALAANFGAGSAG
ncbi:MAG: prepilin peptidase [Roseinatronobacter sp.]